MRKHGLEEILERFGSVLYTGSFAADLMTHGDIDIYVIGQWNKTLVRKIFETLLDELDVKAWQLFNWIKYRDPRFPKGWYIGLRDVYRNRKWKIDIWFLTQKQVAGLPFVTWENRKITDRQRQLILSFKQYRDGHKLEIQSFDIYQAVLTKGAKSIGQVLSYCRKQK